jgi:hypothetical protein
VRQVTSRAMFYAQAAATVRYLYEADDGAQRRKLFDFLRAYYTGDSDKLDLAHELGVLADPLGQRIVEHARRALEQP